MVDSPHSWAWAFEDMSFQPRKGYMASKAFLCLEAVKCNLFFFSDGKKTLSLGHIIAKVAHRDPIKNQV